jgi:uncharacterized SAM-binding protein YcdF (DUF218 family)
MRAATRPRPQRSLARRVLLWSALGLVAAAWIGWPAVLNWLGSYLVCSDAPQRADLIVVMGGDFWGPRVVKAAQLGAQGLAPLVLISGPTYYQRPEGELAVEFLVQHGYSKSLFDVFTHDQRSTLGEVLALKGELSRRGAKRIIVVTSSYHSRRCAILFRLFCPGIRTISMPAPDDNYQPRNWWKDTSSRGLFFSEWTKILGSVAIAYPVYLFTERAQRNTAAARFGGTRVPRPCALVSHNS